VTHNECVTAANSCGTAKRTETAEDLAMRLFQNSG
jgi:hypothetical protein